MNALLIKVLKKLGFFQQYSPSIKQWELMVKREVIRPVKLLLPYISDNAVFIDVGANVGVFTEAILKRRKNITVHLFEPVPKYNEWLEKKFEGQSKIKVNKQALSDENGTFSIWTDSSNLGWNTMISEKASENMIEFPINAIVFDEYAQQHAIKKIDAIKIDVEGAEYRVLKGMRKTLSLLKKKPVIICEIGWGKNANPNWNLEVEMFEWMFENGYKRFDYNKIEQTMDVLFIPV